MNWRRRSSQSFSNVYNHLVLNDVAFQTTGSFAFLWKLGAARRIRKAIAGKCATPAVIYGPDAYGTIEASGLSHQQPAAHVHKRRPIAPEPIMPYHFLLDRAKSSIPTDVFSLTDLRCKKR